LDYQSRLIEAALAALDERRGGHVVRTAQTAAELSGKVEDRFRALSLPGEEPLSGVTLASRAYLAGVLHDSHRTGTGPTPDFPLDEVEGRFAWKLAHAALAAQFAFDNGLRDSGVLFAVRYHTIGHPSPTPLLCSLMLADAVEPGRSYEGVGELRRIAEVDPLAALVGRLRSTTGFVAGQGLEVHPYALALIETLERALEVS
jgi:HD superfamily phosphohydrolase YqeK